MNKPGIFSPITQPSLALEAWSSDPALGRSLRPGLTWLAAFESILGLLFFGLAYLISQGLNAWAQSMGPEVPDRIFALLSEQLKFGLPGQTAALILTGFLATALAVFVASRLTARFLHGPKAGEKANLLFNLLLKMTLPWQVFLLVPLLGWIVAAVGAVLGVWRVLAALFPQHSFGRRLAGGVLVPGLIAAGVHLLSAAMLERLLRPLVLLGL